MTDPNHSRIDAGHSLACAFQAITSPLRPPPDDTLRGGGRRAWRLAQSGIRAQHDPDRISRPRRIAVGRIVMHPRGGQSVIRKAQARPPHDWLRVFPPTALAPQPDRAGGRR